MSSVNGLWAVKTESIRPSPNSDSCGKSEICRFTLDQRDIFRHGRNVSLSVTLGRADAGYVILISWLGGRARLARVI